jgi:trans-aconitate 2-methyltransferase
MSDWDPSLYLRFEAERTRPSMDLVARIEVGNPASIIDVGCGPGNSARVLRERWPGSSILGLDNSPAMIDRAKKDYPELHWTLGDATRLAASEAYDIVFSNAALQWMPDHEKLLPRLLGAAKAGGALAVQIPRFKAMPIHAAIERVAASAKWKSFTAGRAEVHHYHEPGYYYDLLCGLASRVDMWQTLYSHILPSRGAIIEFIRGTGLKPYLDALPGEGPRAEFELEVLAECEKDYPLRADGRLLFPFDRLFFIAYK